MSTAPSTARSEGRNVGAVTSVGLNDEIFPEWVLNNPSFSRARPTFETKTAAEIFRTPVAERSPEQSSQVIEWLQKVWHVARKIGMKRTAQVVSRLKYQCVAARTTICTEGERGEEFYIILSGAVVVTKQVSASSDGTRLLRPESMSRAVAVVVSFHLNSQAVGKVATLRAGHSFGELALTVHGAGRSATCTATEDCELLVLHKRDFEHFALDVQLAERREALACLEQCPLFAGWKRSRLEEVCNLVHRKSFVAGEYIYRQGHASDFLYVILEGQVDIVKEEEITVTNRWPVAVDEWQEVVRRRIKPIRQRTLTPPQCLGELALIGLTKRTTSARARVSTTLLTLDKNEFAHLLRPGRDSDGFERVRILAEDGSYEDEVLLKALDAMLNNLGEQVPTLTYTYSDLYAWSKERPVTARAAKVRPQSAGKPASRSPRRDHTDQPRPLTGRLAAVPSTQTAESNCRRSRRLSTSERHLRNFQAKLLTSPIAPLDSTSSALGDGVDAAADSSREAQPEFTLDGIHRRSVVIARTLKRVRTEPTLLRNKGDQNGKQNGKTNRTKLTGAPVHNVQPLRHHASAPSVGLSSLTARTGKRDRTASTDSQVAYTRKPGSKARGKLGKSTAEHRRDVIAQELQDHFYTHQLGAPQDGHRKAMLLAGTTTAARGRSKSPRPARPNR